MSATILTILFTSASMQYGLQPKLLSSLCWVESKHVITAVHKDDGTSNSVGVCQIKLKTAKWLGFTGTEKQLMDPETNIKYAAKYLAYQQHRYHSITKAVIAYNIGNAKGLTSTNYSRKVFKVWRQHDTKCMEERSCKYPHNGV